VTVTVTVTVREVNSVVVKFVREAVAVQKSTRGQHGNTSLMIRRLYFCVIFGVCDSVRLL
jgi:hypothetical protein